MSFSIGAVRLPDSYIDARQSIEESLKASSRLSFKTFGSLFSILCDVLHHHIEEVEDPESYSNLQLTLTYRMNIFTETGTPSLIEKTRKLRVLTAIGDTAWTYRMIDRLWEGDYPSTVAVDLETGDIFFFNIKLNRLELIEFSRFTEQEFDTFLLEVHDREPFKICLDPNAMFDFIDGAEGINHLKRGIQVEFNCALPIRVSARHK